MNSLLHFTRTVPCLLYLPYNNRYPSKLPKQTGVLILLGLKTDVSCSFTVVTLNKLLENYDSISGNDANWSPFQGSQCVQQLYWRKLLGRE